MACSPLVLTGFLLVTGGLILHVAGTFTPSWSAWDGMGGFDADDLKDLTKSETYGINKRSIDLGSLGNALQKAMKNFVHSKIGPWKSCSVLDICSASKWGDDADWQKATQAVTVVGALAAGGGALLGLILFLLGCCQKSPNGCLVCLASSLSSLAALFMLGGILIWSLKVHHDINQMTAVYVLGYSFYLSCVGAGLTGIGAMVYGCGGRQQ